MSLCIMNPGGSENMRSLIVDNIEKYRLNINDKLVYAKGKINFDGNPPKNGSGNIYDIGENYSFRTSDSYYNCTYGAFYGDGFYQKKEVKEGRDKGKSYYVKFNFDKVGEKAGCSKNLTGYTLNGGYSKSSDTFYDNPPHPALIFCGGLYVKKTENTLSNADINKYIINDTSDIAKKTNLFNYKENNNLPQITLYAYGKVREFDLIVHNIKIGKSQSSQSSFEYKDGNKWVKTDTKSTYKKFKIREGTNIVNFLKNNIRNLSYVSGAAADANTLLKDKADRKKLKANRKFISGNLSVEKDYNSGRNNSNKYTVKGGGRRIGNYANGFDVIEDTYGGSFYPKYITGHDNNTYRIIFAVPIFETVIIYPAGKYPNNATFNGKIVTADGNTKFHNGDNGEALQYHPPAPKYHNTPSHHAGKNLYARYNKTIENTTRGRKTYYEFYYGTRKSRYVSSNSNGEGLGNETIIMEFRYYGYRHIDKDGVEWTLNNRN